MTLIIGIVVWCLIGTVILLRLFWELDSVVTIRDLLVALLGGLLGPFCLVWYFGCTPSSILDKRIF